MIATKIKQVMNIRKKIIIKQLKIKQITKIR